MNDPNQINPFAAPLSDTEGAPQGLSDTSDVLASRGDRFLGALVDGLCLLPGFLIIFIGVFMSGVGLFTGNAGRSLASFGLSAVLGVVYMLGFSIYQWVSISRTGQTVGKRALRTRIVLMDGSPVTFFTGVFLRAWAPLLVGFALGVICAIAKVPGEVGNRIGNLWSLIDVLAIFGASHRCVHDLIAGTKVVKVQAGAGID